MILKKCTAIFAAGLMLANCATVPGEEDDGVPWGWIVAGVAVVAVVALAATASERRSSEPCYSICLSSDERLKRDIEFMDALPNGIRLYSFHYWNDDRTFVGVMAQDLLGDERFRHAVIKDESGYYLVDLGALGLGIEGDAGQFLEAGRAALAEGDTLVN
jgi:hypothetical protein